MSQTHLSPKAPCVTHSQSLILQGVSHGLSLHPPAPIPVLQGQGFFSFGLGFSPLIAFSHVLTQPYSCGQLRKGMGGWR